MKEMLNCLGSVYLSEYELFCRSWHLPDLISGVAGRHRAYPSVSLDKFHLFFCILNVIHTIVRFSRYVN